jgi:hypothetical protein
MFLNRATYLSNAETRAKKGGCCCHRPQLRRVCLFAGLATDKITENKWNGWVTAGQGEGKTIAYDTAPLTAVEFRDSAGTYAIYTLDPGYIGKTMLQIAETQKSTLGKGNTNSEEWQAGLATIGTLIDSHVPDDIQLQTPASVRGNVFSAKLRMGVGDLQRDQIDDWAMWYPLDGSCGSDFFGNKCFAFGTETRLSTHLRTGADFVGTMELVGYTTN